MSQNAKAGFFFLDRVASRSDYPQTQNTDLAMSDDEVRQLSRAVLVAREGEGMKLNPGEVRSSD